MIVVADTSPLNYLIRLGRSEILPKIYGRVLVPSAVLDELRHPGAPAAVRSWALAPPRWLEEVSVAQLDRSLPAKLGAGERYAISLALQERSDLLLVDEIAARSEARRRGIRVAGTLAVLLEAAVRGWVSLPAAIDELRHSGFRVSRAVEEALLQKFSDVIQRKQP